MNLRESAQWLAEQQEASDGVSYTFTRGNDSVTVTAVEGRTPFRQSDTGGRSTLIWSERDILVRAAVLILDGATVLPQPGDQWEKASDSDGVYQVHSIGGEPCYRWSDQYGIRLRIHLKRVREATE